MYSQPDGKAYIFNGEDMDKKDGQKDERMVIAWTDGMVNYEKE